MTGYNYFTAQFTTADGRHGMISALVTTDERGNFPFLKIKSYIKGKLPKTVVPANEELSSVHVVAAFAVATNDASLGGFRTEVTFPM